MLSRRSQSKAKQSKVKQKLKKPCKKITAFGDGSRLLINVQYILGMFVNILIGQFLISIEQKHNTPTHRAINFFLIKITKLNPKKCSKQCQIK